VSNVAKNRAKRGQQIVPISAGRGRVESQSELLSVSQAANLLGVSLRTFKRHLAQGKISPHSKSPGGHWRFKQCDLETFQQTVAPIQASPILRQKRDHIEELNLTLQERKAKVALRELEDEERSRAETEQAEREARERAATRMRLEEERERARRQRERDQIAAKARAVQARQEWEAEWLRDMLRRLPRDLPNEWRLAAIEGIREKLDELYTTSSGHAEDLVGVALCATVEANLRPWRRAREADKAACEALQELPIFARGFGQATDWDRRAKAQALAGIDALPETATFEQMAAVGRTAVKRVAQEYEHAESCASFLNAIRRALPREFPLSGPQARAKAEEAVRVAVEALPVGARTAEFEAARDAVLNPFVASEQEARVAHEAKESRARLEADADKYLYFVPSYLARLEANPEGWDFDGKRQQYAEQIKTEIKPHLLEELPLDFMAGQQRVQQLVDEWLATHVEFP
jgi:excisionase family DNA binding protein